MKPRDGWSQLPYPVLQRIYSLLPLKNVGRCSQVCCHWYSVFLSDDAWRSFTFRDFVLVRRRFTEYGYQYQMDHMKMRLFIPMMVHRWREFQIDPVTILFNLYDFMKILTNFSEYHEVHSEDKPLGDVRRFSFKWGLHVRDRMQGGDVEEKDIGTGGEMLRTLRILLSHLHGLKDLEILHLQLNATDAEILMGELLEKFQLSLRRLCLLNCTLSPHPFLHLGLFLNLSHLVISPQHLSDNSLQLLGPLVKLKTLHIIQAEKTLDATACSSSSWRDFSSTNHGRTRLFLVIRGKPKEPLLIQPSAPVYGIIFERSTGQLTMDMANEICDNYSSSLVRFAQLGLERMKRSNLVQHRVDRAAVEIVLRCRKLSLFCIRERVSSGTALLLPSLSKDNTLSVHLRKNGLLKRVSWSRSEVECLGYGINFDWLKKSSRSYESCEEELLRLTGSKLVLMTDKRYKDSFR